MAMVFTDHMPMFGFYKVPTKAEEVPTVRFQLWPDLKRGDEKAIQDIKAALERLPAGNNAEEDIRRITETTVNAHRALVSERRKRK